MTRLLRLVALAVGVGLAVWLLRNRRVAPAGTGVRPTPTPRPQPPAMPPPATPRREEEAAPGAAGDNPADDLTTIHGIGPTFSDRLADAGIHTFAALADADPGPLAERIRSHETTVRDWVEQARDRTR